MDHRGYDEGFSDAIEAATDALERLFERYKAQGLQVTPSDVRLELDELSRQQAGY